MAIKLQKLHEEKKNGKLTLRMSGVGEVFANTLRRLIVEEVPTLAVEDVEVKSNDSALYDEMLALRLGLLPIKTDLKSYRLPQNEDEVTERSAQCTLQIKLKASKKGYVYSGEAESSDPKCTFVHDKMPVTKLLAKQKVDLTMTAVMGQGKVHSKWSPGWAFFKREPVLKLGSVKNPQLVAQKCSDGVFSLKGEKLVLDQDKVYSSKLAEYYAELDEGISLSYSDNIIFMLESWGQLSTKEILSTSAQILAQKTQELEAQL